MPASSVVSEASRILESIEEGDPKAAEELLPLVYEELRNLAVARMRQEGSGHTLQPTALVHEAYLRLLGPDGDRLWEGRRHFFGAAAEAMRRVLIDHARAKRSKKRGGEWDETQFDFSGLAGREISDSILDVDSALAEFEKTEPEKASVVKLRYFVGLTNQETADALGISPATVKRHWVYSRAWLYDWMNRERSIPEDDADPDVSTLR